MSRSESSRDVSGIVLRASRSSGCSPVRSTSVPAVRADQMSGLGRGHTFSSCPTRPSTSSLSTIACADSSGDWLSVSTTTSGRRRLLIRVVHPGEAGDLALERLLVQALHVAARALVDRRLDVDLDERAELLDHLAGFVARLDVRRDRRGDDRGAVPCQPGRDPADALDVRVAILLREAEALREVRADGVSVQVLDDVPALLEERPDQVGDRALARAGEPGEPQGEAALPFLVRLGMLVRVDVFGHFSSMWMPHSSLSEPAQRPARSSSSGLVGRVQGMHPIDRYPTSCSGL